MIYQVSSFWILARWVQGSSDFWRVYCLIIVFAKTDVMHLSPLVPTVNLLFGIEHMCLNEHRLWCMKCLCCSSGPNKLSEIWVSGHYLLPYSHPILFLKVNNRLLLFHINRFVPFLSIIDCLISNSLLKEAMVQVVCGLFRLTRQ